MAQAQNTSQDAVSGLQPLSYLNQNQPANVLFVRLARAPKTTDRRFKFGTIWLDTASNAVYALVNVTNNSAFWSLLGIGSGDLETLTGDSGGAVSPLAGNIDIKGGTNITVAGTPNTLTINSTAGAAETLTGNSGGAVGPDGADNINVIGSGVINVVGNPGTNTLTISSTGSTEFPITPFVVGPVGKGGFQTIQAGLDAANAAGGGVVGVQPGTFNENLTLFTDTFVVGLTNSLEDAPVVISGVHTPPTSGRFGFEKCKLTSATDIFLNAGAGSTDLFINNCVITIQDGYIFNLNAWGGELSVNDSHKDASTTDGVLNNAGGDASLFINNSIVGSDSAKTLVAPGDRIEIMNSEIGCPVTVSGGGMFDVTGSLFNAPVTINANKIALISYSTFATDAGAAITFNSNVNGAIFQSAIASSNSPALAGTGGGPLELENVSFLDNTEVSGSITTVRKFSLFGTVSANELEITEGSNARMGTAVLTAGAVTVANTSVTASTRIFLTSQIDGGTPGFLRVSGRTAGVNFTITSGSGADTSTIGWVLIEPA